MNRIGSKYTTILVVCSLLLGGSLQVIWLNQLFKAQQKQLKDDLEHLVSTTTQASWYQSVTTFEKPKNLPRIKKLFLSPQWEQLRRAFDNMKAAGLSANIRIESNDDSTSASIRISLKDSATNNGKALPVTSNTGLTEEQLQTNDSLSLIQLKKDITNGLHLLGVTTPIYHNIYTYNMDSLYDSNIPNNQQPAWTSNGYLYGIRNHYRYQLALPAINYLVWYRMRYYVVSSIFMMALTAAAFYFILRLLKNARLYADAKADFTRNMTHELKTPIATASVALESIKKYNLLNDPETLQSYIDISRHELRRLDGMVEKALNLGTDSPFKPELYDVQTGLQQVITSMQLQLNDRSTITFHPSTEPCFVFGDPMHLTNIFYNLVENAIKYSKDVLTMTITCSCNPNTVTISFEDNGPGIGRIYQQKIFEKFFRVPAKDNTHDIKGSGLGLYYVKQMIERHEGTIRVKSEPGSGACFIITLKTAS